MKLSDIFNIDLNKKSNKKLFKQTIDKYNLGKEYKDLYDQIHKNNNNNNNELLGDCISYFVNGTQYGALISPAQRTVLVSENYPEDYCKVYNNVKYKGEFYDCLAILANKGGKTCEFDTYNSANCIFNIIFKNIEDSTILDINSNDIKYRYYNANGSLNESILTYVCKFPNEETVKILVSSGIDILNDIEII